VLGSGDTRLAVPLRAAGVGGESAAVACRTQRVLVHVDNVLVEQNLRHTSTSSVVVVGEAESLRGSPSS